MGAKPRDHHAASRRPGPGLSRRVVQARRWWHPEYRRRGRLCRSGARPIAIDGGLDPGDAARVPEDGPPLRRIRIRSLLQLADRLARPSIGGMTVVRTGARASRVTGPAESAASYKRQLRITNAPHSPLSTTNTSLDGPLDIDTMLHLQLTVG